MPKKSRVLTLLKNIVIGSAIVTKASAGVVATTFAIQDPSVWQKVRREIQNKDSAGQLLPEDIEEMLSGKVLEGEDLVAAMRLSYASVSPGDYGRVDRFWLLHPRVQGDPAARRAFFDLKSSLFQLGILPKPGEGASVILASSSESKSDDDDDDDSGGYDS